MHKAYKALKGGFIRPLRALCKTRNPRKPRKSQKPRKSTKPVEPRKSRNLRMPRKKKKKKKKKKKDRRRLPGRSALPKARPQKKMLLEIYP